MRLFVTGGAGFIGSNYVRHVLASTDDAVTVFDALTYAGTRENLSDIEGDARFTFVEGDIGRALRGREPRRPLDHRS
jgi:dTDP-glucose 4,6-dehydratase